MINEKISNNAVMNEYVNIYDVVTEKIIKALEAGTIPWKKPWSGISGCISYITGKPYSLLNHILLDGVAGEYLTFDQCNQAGGWVKKGEKSKIIAFWKMVPSKTDKEKMIPCLRYYKVFHISQCIGIRPRWTNNVINETLIPSEKADAVVNDYVQNSKVRLNIKNTSEAFYNPALDEVIVPELSQYGEIADYYSTLFHELVHSTGHKDRLNRLDNTTVFGDREYSKEELVAELGSAFLLNYLGLESQVSIDNSAAYINGWLSLLKNDRHLLVRAASAAEKAVELIINQKKEGLAS